MKFDNNCLSGFRKKSCLKLFKYAIFNTSKQKVGHCDETTLQIFFIFIILNTYVPIIFHAKIQPKISSGSGEKVDFFIFAIFSNGGHLGYST